MDEDGDGGISATEYVLFNLIARREVDPDVVKQLKQQFSAMDLDRSGTLTADDFPTSVCIQRSVTICDGSVSTVELDIVPMEEAGTLLRETTGVSTLAIDVAGKLKWKAKSMRDLRSASSLGQSAHAANPMAGMASMAMMGAIAEKSQAAGEKILV
jgi:hypothetical protein